MRFFLKLILGFFMANVASANVCDLNQYYSDQFTFSLPRQILESFFDGKAFDNRESYTPEERANLEKDINAIWERVRGNSSSNPVATITAGSPGAGKTCLLRQLMGKSGLPYTDPDDVCLKNMPATYQAELENRLKALATMKFSSPEAALKAERDIRQEMYNKWRPASNGGAQAMLAEAIRNKFDFYYGTTSSSPQTAKFFEFLKKHNYTIQLIHITAPDDVRWNSIKERDKVFVQTTEQDIKEKGLLVPQRIMDAYLKFADQIEFYYRSAVVQDGILAATWTRDGGLIIKNQEAYEGIKKVHNAACDLLDRPDIRWEKTNI